MYTSTYLYTTHILAGVILSCQDPCHIFRCPKNSAHPHPLIWKATLHQAIQAVPPLCSPHITRIPSFTALPTSPSYPSTLRDNKLDPYHDLRSTNCHALHPRAPTDFASYTSRPATISASTIARDPRVVWPSRRTIFRTCRFDRETTGAES